MIFPDYNLNPVIDARSRWGITPGSGLTSAQGLKVGSMV